jgi:hypothetical protein
MRDPGIGSFFAYPTTASLGVSLDSEGPMGWPPGSWVLVNSGRAALATIVIAHMSNHPRARLWVPSYYCWDVTRYITQWIPVVTYPCRPTHALLPGTVPPDDLLLVTSYFGSAPPRVALPTCRVVLDTTHDPLAEWIPAFGSEWVFGSLRKTLPLAEGGFAYPTSRLAEHLDAPPCTAESRAVVAQGVEAMLEKSRWVDGQETLPKEAWYLAFQQHESAICAQQPAAIQPESVDLLQRLPVRRWRDQRLQNLRALRDALDADLLTLALPSTYGLPLVLPDSDCADRMRRTLISDRVYPARLWPQPEIAPTGDVDLASRMLFLHTDHRYDFGDMQRVAGILNGCATP